MCSDAGLHLSRGKGAFPGLHKGATWAHGVLKEEDFKLCASIFVWFCLAVLKILPLLGQNFILRVCTMVCLLRRWGPAYKEEQAWRLALYTRTTVRSLRVFIPFMLHVGQILFSSLLDQGCDW